MAVPGKIEVELVVEVGSAELSLQKLLSLSRGTVVRLGCDANQPLKILANGRHIAEARVALDGERVNAAVMTAVRQGNRFRLIRAGG